jgi:hypothetical protein
LHWLGYSPSIHDRTLAQTNKLICSLLVAIKDVLDNHNLLDQSLEEKEAIVREEKMRHARGMTTDFQLI